MVATTSPRVVGRVRDYALLMRLDKPIGALLLLWPALWALWIAAEGEPSEKVLWVFVAGVWIMRSAGCVMNDCADRNFDRHVARTRQRPLAAGRVTVREALVLFAVLSLIAFALVLLLNPLAVALSFVGIVLAATYPFAKRHTYLPQIHLGLAFGWAAPMAFAAQSGGLPTLAWLVFIAAIIWALVYDTIYAMVDREDDIFIGIKSTAILFDELDRAFIAGFQIALLAVLLLIGQQAKLGLYYQAGLAIGAVLFFYQQHLIRDRDPARCFKAFLNNNWFGLAVFAGIACDYWLAGPR